MLPFSFPGFEIQEVSVDGARLCISARSTSPTAECATCHQLSARLHSYYLRSPVNLPVSGQTVHLKLRVRRFRCQNQRCTQQTFGERFPEMLAAHAQRIHRLTAILTLFALALSGRGGERLLLQVGILTSADTLLRLVKQAATPLMRTPEVLGVDDFAFRRGKTYGTILVDLETNRPIDLLTERTGDALADWLREPPAVKLMSRDRSSEYARGAAEGAPEAKQIVDRWHVLKNLGGVVLPVVGRTHDALKQRQAASGVQVRARYRKLRIAVQADASGTVVLEEPLESPRHLSWILLRDQAGLNHQEQQMLGFIRQEPTIEVAMTWHNALARW